MAPKTFLIFLKITSCGFSGTKKGVFDYPKYLFIHSSVAASFFVSVFLPKKIFQIDGFCSGVWTNTSDTISPSSNLCHAHKFKDFTDNCQKFPLLSWRNRQQGSDGVGAGSNPSLQIHCLNFNFFV